jgi:hypothetical protein
MHKRETRINTEGGCILTSRGRVADASRVLDDQHVGTQRHVGAAGDTEAMDLAQHWLVAVEQ